MNLINKIFNRKIAGDTSNIILPDATGIDSGIEYKSAVNSNVPNGLFNHISDAIQYLQFSVGLYSNTAQYTEGNICKVITKENGHYQIRVFRRNGNNAGSTVANPPVPTAKTTANGIDCYEVENETEWNTDWDECETGLAYWEFKIEGKTITEATTSFDNRDSVGATWTKAHIQELYDSVRNFRVVYYYNCLITTHNIVKEGNVIKGSFSFENIARYTMKFEYNLDANSFTSCSCNIFHYNSSIKELNSDQLYNSVKGNILKCSKYNTVTIMKTTESNTSATSFEKHINLKDVIQGLDNVSIQGFTLKYNIGTLCIGSTYTTSNLYQFYINRKANVGDPLIEILIEMYDENQINYYKTSYSERTMTSNATRQATNETMYLDIPCRVFNNRDTQYRDGYYLYGGEGMQIPANHTGNSFYLQRQPLYFLGDKFTFKMGIKGGGFQGYKLNHDLRYDIVVYYFDNTGL